MFLEAAVAEFSLQLIRITIVLTKNERMVCFNSDVISYSNKQQSEGDSCSEMLFTIIGAYPRFSKMISCDDGRKSSIFKIGSDLVFSC